jgi:hypothetical protein
MSYQNKALLISFDFFLDISVALSYIFNENDFHYQ